MELLFLRFNIEHFLHLYYFRNSCGDYYIPNYFMFFKIFYLLFLQFYSYFNLMLLKFLIYFIKNFLINLFKFKVTNEIIR